jgi:ABC-2 type transport system ATP-binding protein
VHQLEEAFGGEVPRLTVTRPTLEDIYLKLIGSDNIGRDNSERGLP